jgi:hypothetical protein
MEEDELATGLNRLVATFDEIAIPGAGRYVSSRDQSSQD